MKTKHGFSWTPYIGISRNQTHLKLGDLELKSEALRILGEQAAKSRRGEVLRSAGCEKMPQ